MSLTNEEKQAVVLYQQILRLGPKPDYARKLETLLKNHPAQPEDRPKQMLYAAHMYLKSYKYEDGESKNRASFHGYLGILQMMNLTEFMSPLWLNWRENKDFSNERARIDELNDVGHNALNSVEYNNFNAYQDSIADDVKDTDHFVDFRCPSGLIVKYKDLFFIIKRQIKNCNMLFKDAKMSEERACRQQISSNPALWKGVELEVAKFVEIDEDDELEVKDNPTYVIPTFGEGAITSLQKYGREFSHAAKTQFLLYAHKDVKDHLTNIIKYKENRTRRKKTSRGSTLSTNKTRAIHLWQRLGEMNTLAERVLDTCQKTKTYPEI
jgi:hypothetical protein